MLQLTGRVWNLGPMSRKEFRTYTLRGTQNVSATELHRTAVLCFSSFSLSVLAGLQSFKTERSLKIFEVRFEGAQCAGREPGGRSCERLALRVARGELRTT